MALLRTEFPAIGEIVRYETFGCDVRSVVVTEVEEDIKNGLPGFEGHLVGDPTALVWGYNHQII